LPVGPGGAVEWPAPFAPRALPRFVATAAQSAPGRRIGTFGLAGPPLAPFPFASPARFSRSVPKPGLESCHFYAGHHMASKQIPRHAHPRPEVRAWF
jgi:hypothetical protein